MKITVDLLQIILSVLSLALSGAVIAVVIKNNRWLKKKVALLQLRMTDVESRRETSDGFTLELIDKVDKVEKGNGHKEVKQPRRRGKFVKKE